MNRKCIAALMAGGFLLGTGFFGAAAQAAGGYIFTREKAGAALLPALPVLLASLVMTAAGLALGIRDENAEKPVRDEKLLRDLGSMQRCAARQAEARGTLYLRAAVFAAALALIVLGILNGGLEDVLAKGAAICTECIGLG